MTARLFLAAALLVCAGCRGISDIGVEHTQTQTIERDKSEMVRVELTMGAGELRLEGGTAKLMDGTFRFHGRNEPELRYEPNNFRSRLVVRSRSTRDHGFNIGGAGEQWNVRLNEDTPMDLSVKLGAGENRLDLGNFSIRDLDVDMGVGAVRLDLRGTPKRNMNVRVRGGIGEAQVFLPAQAGLRANASGGIGSVNVHGIPKRGIVWENDLYETAKTTVNVDVRGGIGAITIRAE